MPKMMSLKAMLANRQNAAQSTGPVTTEGKARVSQNAIRHGLNAGSVVIPGENAEDFNVLRTAFYDEFLPQTPFEIGCVDRMVVARWRARRALAYEVASAEGERNRGYRFDPRLYLPRPEVAEKLIRYECMLERHFTRAYQQLLQYRLLSLEQPSDPPPQQPKPPPSHYEGDHPMAPEENKNCENKAM